MRKHLILLITVIVVGCRPYYIKDRHFDCRLSDYNVDSDIKELVYRSLKRAVVAEKDIPDYILFWKKHRIYVSNAYQTEVVTFTNTQEWMSSASFLKSEEVPPRINHVEFCLKSREELQHIADQTKEDFLHLSFSMIQIDESTATIKIDNTWISHKRSKNVYLSGGGYTAIYHKVDGKWRFERITESWIS